MLERDDARIMSIHSGRHGFSSFLAKVLTIKKPSCMQELKPEIQHSTDSSVYMKYRSGLTLLRCSSTM